MLKKIIALSLICAMLVPLSPVVAADETTGTVYANTLSDHLEVTMWLMDGTTCVASWHGSGDGYVTMSKTATVIPGRTYKLVVEVIANGVAKDPVYVTGTC